MRLRKQRKALSIIDGQTGRSITEQHSPFPLLEVNRMTPQHEAINADHCAAQWLYTVSLTPPRCSQRSNTHCPSPAAEQSRPLLPNVQGLGQGSLGTTKLETNAHKCGKENETHSHEGPSHHPPSTLRSQTIKLLDFPFISPLRVCGDALHRSLLMSFLLPWGKSLSLTASHPRPVLLHTVWISTPVSLLRRHRRGFGLEKQSTHHWHRSVSPMEAE